MLRQITYATATLAAQTATAARMHKTDQGAPHLLMTDEQKLRGLLAAVWWGELTLQRSPSLARGLSDESSVKPSPALLALGTTSGSDLRRSANS